MDLVDKPHYHLSASHSIDPVVCPFTPAVWIQPRHQIHHGQINYFHLPLWPTQEICFLSLLCHSSLFRNVFLFVMGVLIELMLFFLNNQITKTRRGLWRTCDLNVIFFFNKWKISKEGCFFKTNYNCNSQSSTSPEDEELSYWTAIPCVWHVEEKGPTASVPL